MMMKQFYKIIHSILQKFKIILWNYSYRKYIIYLLLSVLSACGLICVAAICVVSAGTGRGRGSGISNTGNT